MTPLVKNNVSVNEFVNASVAKSENCWIKFWNDWEPLWFHSSYRYFFFFVYVNEELFSVGRIVLIFLFLNMILVTVSFVFV